jgi:1,4-alpha-glucan branching enzyme/maltooligosyltrehalose trehalohydrolase
MHSMPFGAEFAPEATRFRLWAPACDRVQLRLGCDGSARTLTMQASGEGWHEAKVEGVKAGEAYAFVLPDGAAVPDPASRSNPRDVNGPSAVVDPRAFDWPDDAWRGRPWNEAVIYELHVGTFTPEGTYAAAIGKLDHLVDTGITAIELLPLADFAGSRNWGYDGVLPFAPDRAYGAPEDLKRLVAECHARGLMVFLDVVYNHFGPEGNYLSRYAPQFFNPAHQTPWGAAINFDGEQRGPVRDFFTHNALYWLEEYHFDGLRLDAVHAIMDESDRHVVMDIAAAISRLGRPNVHMVLENDANIARFLDGSAGAASTAQWNDDSHHGFHVLMTGETDGYYVDYADAPARHLARTLAEGFAYQGEPSKNKKGEARGEPSKHLPLTCFIDFLQNHDQVGNRAMGERIVSLAPPEAMRLGIATLLLAPSIPMLFMGEEFGATTPFLFFCDFHGDLATAVREGRRKEFASFERFRDPKVRETIPDPLARETFEASKLRWDDLRKPEHAGYLALHRELLAIRRGAIVPRIARPQRAAGYATFGKGGIAVDWTLGDGAKLHVRANFSGAPVSGVPAAAGEALFSTGSNRDGELGAWGGTWTLEVKG